ncbi:hypothetical protein ACLKA6_006785 [Drosophila palustris]
MLLGPASAPVADSSTIASADLQMKLTLLQDVSSPSGQTTRLQANIHQEPQPPAGSQHVHESCLGPLPLTAPTTCSGSRELAMGMGVDGYEYEEYQDENEEWNEMLSRARPELTQEAPYIRRTR